jgi:sorting nexin-25
MVMPTIDLVCDPDFLNQKIINYLTEKENSNKLLKRTFSYAANYEDFIKMIKASSSLEEMKQFHYKIMTEIMQATIINEFKNSQDTGENSSVFYADDSTGSDPVGLGNQHKASSSSDLHSKSTKAEMLRSRNLKAYLKQLRYAKQLCVRRMNQMKYSTMMYIDEDVEIVDQQKNLDNMMKSKKVRAEIPTRDV